MKRKLVVVALIATAVAAGATSYLLVGRQARLVDVISLFATGMAFGVTMIMTVQQFRMPK